MCEINNIVTVMREQVVCDLTIGKTDNLLQPFNNQEIKDYLDQNKDLILQAATDMYETYTQDGDIDDLGDGSFGESDWYREFLYNYI